MGGGRESCPFSRARSSTRAAIQFFFFFFFTRCKTLADISLRQLSPVSRTRVIRVQSFAGFPISKSE